MAKLALNYPEESLPLDLNSIAISPNGETLISGGRDQTIKVWKRQN